MGYPFIYIYIFYFGGYFLKANMCNVFHGFDKGISSFIAFLFRKSNKVKEKNIVIHKVCYNNIKPI